MASAIIAGGFDCAECSFCGAEIAIVSVNDNKMAKLAKEGNKKQKIL